MYANTIYVTSADQEEIRPLARGDAQGRDALAIDNESANDIYVEFDIAADTNSLVIPAGENREWARSGTTGFVPQGSVWILGSQAGRQKVRVRQSPKS